ncbi:MAG: ABC transporter permease [Kiloniellales bacterium]
MSDLTLGVDLRQRHFGAVNWRGLWTLYWRNLARFLKLAMETLGAPAVTALLFIAVFVLALEGREEMLPGISVARFVAPGIVMFSLLHCAFESAAFPILYDKMEGMIQDVAAAPLSPIEILLGYAFAATSCALFVGVAVTFVVSFFVETQLVMPLALIGFAAAAALLFALFGTLVGLWADKWEHYAAAETFLVLPLGLLSGAFFTLRDLPHDLHWLFAINPVFHAINGFRYGFIGESDASLATGIGFLLLLDLLLAVFAWRLFVVGYKIRA